MAALQNQNRLAKAPEPERGLTEYECGGQLVKISPALIRKYLVNGNGAVTDQEVMMFLSMCKFQKLNPFLREAYLIKYGSQPATIVTGKEAFMKRAMRNPAYAGQEAGVVVVIDETGQTENRIGTIVLPGETLVGGWAKVYVKGWELPLTMTVSFDEYCQKKNDGTPMSNWAAKPATMIRKVALVQALREAFPEDLGGMHAPEEAGVMDIDMPTDVIPEEVIDAETVQDEEPKQASKPAISTEVSKKPTSAVQSALFDG